MKRTVLQTKEKGASSWLAVKSIQEHGFVLTKSEFRDALRIKHNKQLQGMPRKCPWGQKYDLKRAMNYEKGGFVVASHNNVRDFEANLLKTIQNGVEIEPALQEIDHERIDGRTRDEARPNIQAWGVWLQGQNADFEIRLTNVNANFQKYQTVETILKKYEKEKKRVSNSHIMNVEHRTSTPLLGAKVPEVSMFHKHIAQPISAKTEENYDRVLFSNKM